MATYVGKRSSSFPTFRRDSCANIFHRTHLNQRRKSRLRTRAPHHTHACQRACGDNFVAHGRTSPTTFHVAARSCLIDADFRCYARLASMSRSFHELASVFQRTSVTHRALWRVGCVHLYCKRSYFTLHTRTVALTPVRTAARLHGCT